MLREVSPGTAGDKFSRVEAPGGFKLNAAGKTVGALLVFGSMVWIGVGAAIRPDYEVAIVDGHVTGNEGVGSHLEIGKGSVGMPQAGNKIVVDRVVSTTLLPANVTVMQASQNRLIQGYIDATNAETDFHCLYDQVHRLMRCSGPRVFKRAV